MNHYFPFYYNKFLLIELFIYLEHSIIIAIKEKSKLKKQIFLDSSKNLFKKTFLVLITENMPHLSE